MRVKKLKNEWYELIVILELWNEFLKENVKFKYEEIQYKLYKKHLEMSRMHKEIVALNSALKGEFRIKELYEVGLRIS